MGAKGGFLEEVSLGTGYFIQGRNGGRERILQSKLVAKMALTQEILALVWPQMGRRQRVLERIYYVPTVVLPYLWRVCSKTPSGNIDCTEPYIYNVFSYTYIPVTNFNL